MRIRTWLYLLGAALLASSAPAVSAARTPAATQSSAAKKKPKKKAKPRVVGQQAPTPDRIREIQSALIREGALSGEPSGKWDAATTAAMQKYQTSQGLDATGKVDALTLQKLGLGSEIAGKAAPNPPAPTTPASPAPAPSSPSSQ